MDPRHLRVDDRLLGVCVYCGGPPDTSDHVPSKVLLDDPLPVNLPVVEACATCNRAFSLDEEYLACFLDCVLSGSAEPAALQREKTRRTLLHSPELGNRLRMSRQVDDAGAIIWAPENDRVWNIVVKLARGHAAFELSLPQLDEPEEVVFRPLPVMSDEERAAFENEGGGELQGWPEIGSRAFLRACGAFPCEDQDGPWIVVQPRRYRYSVDESDGVLVCMVLADYLACYVRWG
jgi:hypothetical protein